MTTPQPHHRYQSSLETRPALDDAERSRARTTFYHVVDHFKTQGATDEAKYDHVSLVRSTYEYARSPRSKDSFLRAFFDFMDLDIGGENHVNLQGEHEEAKLRCNLVNFATFLFENFFLPCKCPSCQQLAAMFDAFHDSCAISDALLYSEGFCKKDSSAHTSIALCNTKDP